METEFTHFAPAGRANDETLTRDNLEFNSLSHVREVLDALPFMALILNKERQIVFHNQTVLNAFGISEPLSLLGRRPGEMIHCTHATKMPGGCGTSEYCRYCGAVKAIECSYETREKVTEECRITSSYDGKEEAWDLRVTATPFFLNNQQFTILSLSDISHEQRRKAIERIFFHDVINTAAGLDGFIGFLKESNENPESAEFIEVAQRLSQSLMDEIVAQRIIVNAESGDLTVNTMLINSADLVNEVVDFMTYHQVAENKTILVDEQSCAAVFKTDPVLLRRVLINMLKNSLEAVGKNCTVKIGCIAKNDSLVFWVQNEGVMPEEVQRQIFQRSYSSKGAGRGLGTYSMKLITEQYLKGRIDFESAGEKGTLFKVRIPLF